MVKSPEVKVYFPEALRDRWDKFVKICSREGSSASEKIRDFVLDYVDAHDHGNPQTLLDSQLGPVKHRPDGQGDPWLELPCEMRNTWGRCQVLREPCSRAMCPRENPRTRRFLEDLAD